MPSLIYFNRYYLQSIPHTALEKFSDGEEEEYGETDELICTFLIDLHRAAVKGHTSYLFDMSKYIQVSPEAKVEFSYTIPLEELIHNFESKFNGCKVTYKEDWVVDGIIKKGVCIDWS